MDHLFFPVRVLDREWAEKFADGEIFMRSLSQFGSWKRLEVKDDGTLVNSFRGDISEGAIKNVSEAEKDDFFRSLPNEIKDAFKNGKMIDMGDPQYFHLLCFYSLRYHYIARQFESPSEKIKQFGDTAVVIKDTDAFLIRLLERLESAEKYIFLLNPIRYYEENSPQTLNPFFCKTTTYSWQNELRIAIAQLDEKAVLPNGEHPIINSTEPLKLEIGSLRDIIQMVPIDDFIHGTWDMSQVRFANSITERSVIDIIMQTTKEIISEYTPTKWNYIFSI